MDKFTKIKSNNEKNIEQNSGNTGSLQVINYKDWDFVKEKDMVAVLPYFVDDGCIYLRIEPIPTYQYGYQNDQIHKNMESFLTIISGKIEDGENPKNTVRRELFEEAGVVLNSMVDIELSRPLFLNKGNCSKYYLCLLELRYNDYRQTNPKGDGSENEKKSKTIKIDLGYLDDIKTHDLITELMLDKLKMTLKPKNQ
jgi:8-oxo-dGTP pyrophosphatase MutT (NUDIX family)